jgi:hypothetical protein
MCDFSLLSHWLLYPIAASYDIRYETHLGSSKSYGHGPVGHGLSGGLVDVLVTRWPRRPQAVHRLLQGQHDLTATLRLKQQSHHIRNKTINLDVCMHVFVGVCALMSVCLLWSKTTILLIRPYQFNSLFNGQMKLKMKWGSSYKNKNKTRIWMKWKHESKICTLNCEINRHRH